MEERGKIKIIWYKTFPDNLNVIENRPGIYLISVLLKSGKFAVIYAGQSHDLKARIKNHFSNSEDNEKLKEYLSNNYTFKISYSYVTSDKLDAIEKQLINEYDPAFNIQEGNGDRCLICNLPNVIRFPS